MAKKKSAPKKSVTKKNSVKKVTAKKAVVKNAVAKKAIATGKSLAPKAVSFKNFLTPLDDRLLVKVSDMERKTAGGLYIPDTVADVSGNLEGVVIAAGRGHRDNKGRLRPLDVKVGDRVIFSSYTGNKIELQGQSVVILREAEVMGVVNK